MNENERDGTHASRLGLGGWLTLVVLGGLLAAAIWFAVHSWNALEGIDISTTGWVFIVIGVLLTVGLGAGLMALVFYSSRKDYDR